MPRIKKGKRKEHKVICKNCESTIGYFKEEIKKYSGTDPWGYSEGSEWIKCPNCKKDIIFKSW